MKIKFLKIKKNYQKENFKINPNIYWEVIVVLSLLLIIASFIFAYFFFIKINEEYNLITENGNIKIGDREKEKIKNALEYFSEREKKSTEILNSPTSIVDPSL